MDIVVRGRNVEVPDHYRRHVVDKLGRVERFDHKLISVDVELYHERNPRQSDICQRVEITCTSRGPVVRSEACAPDFYSALDGAVTKLQNRLRKLADRRRVHHGSRTPTSVAAATTAAWHSSTSATSTATLERDEASPQETTAPGHDAAGHPGDPSTSATASRSGSANVGQAVPDDETRTGDQVTVRTEPDGPAPHGAVSVRSSEVPGPGRIVREKEHPAKPMSIDQALFEMELVGHDFYLFNDADSGRPTVVYRRRGYDYGIIRLTE